VRRRKGCHLRVKIGGQNIFQMEPETDLRNSQERKKNLFYVGKKKKLSKPGSGRKRACRSLVWDKRSEDDRLLKNGSSISKMTL